MRLVARVWAGLGVCRQAAAAAVVARLASEAAAVAALADLGGSCRCSSGCL